MQFSRTAEEADARDARVGLSKLNSMPQLELGGIASLAGSGPVDVSSNSVVASHGASRTSAIGRLTRGSELAPSKGLPRKEVIQPHLPVRLPCYDFTPVTGPTFDGSLPKGLGHRLRVLPTPVV